MLHHLMLQLLRSFPGSYLVRAQQGDLKFMLAFTSPAAAVAWGITLQEASLYLPYPQEVRCNVSDDVTLPHFIKLPSYNVSINIVASKCVVMTCV